MGHKQNIHFEGFPANFKSIGELHKRIVHRAKLSALMCRSAAASHDASAACKQRLGASHGQRDDDDARLISLYSNGPTTSRTGYSRRQTALLATAAIAMGSTSTRSVYSTTSALNLMMVAAAAGMFGSGSDDDNETQPRANKRRRLQPDTRDTLQEMIQKDHMQEEGTGVTTRNVERDTLYPSGSGSRRRRAV